MEEGGGEVDWFVEVFGVMGGKKGENDHKHVSSDFNGNSHK